MFGWNSKKDKASPEVLIVGAGPVGLWAGVLLNEFEIPFQILDQEGTPEQHDYFITLHPATLKLLSEVGLLSEVIANGFRVNSMGIYNGPNLEAMLDLTNLKTEYPFLIVIPQAFLEDLFERRLKQREVEISRNKRVVDLEFKPTGGIIASIQSLGWESEGYPIATSERIVEGTQQIETQFVIGADGHHSSVRRILGIPFDDAGATELFVEIDFTTNAKLGNEASLAFLNSRRGVVWPLPGNQGQGLFQLDSHEIQGNQDQSRIQYSVQIGSKSYPTIADAMAFDLLNKNIPTLRNHELKVNGSVVARFERHLARCFGQRTAWLCGDAAHTTSPIGAQSLNAGFTEAHDLVSRISQIRSGADLKLLENYDRERLADWKKMLLLDGSVLGGKNVSPWLLEHRQHWVTDLPGTGKELDQMLALLDLKFPSPEKKRLPDRAA